MSLFRWYCTRKDKIMTFLQRYKAYREYGFSHAEAMASAVEDEKVVKGWV